MQLRLQMAVVGLVLAPLLGCTKAPNTYYIDKQRAYDDAYSCVNIARIRAIGLVSSGQQTAQQAADGSVADVDICMKGDGYSCRLSICHKYKATVDLVQVTRDVAAQNPNP